MSFYLQFLLTMHYLSEMTEEQTLALYSGHPLGLFPSSPRAPRVVITNGMVRSPITFGRLGGGALQHTMYV